MHRKFSGPQTESAPPHRVQTGFFPFFTTAGVDSTGAFTTANFPAPRRFPKTAAPADCSVWPCHHLRLHFAHNFGGTSVAANHT